MPTPNPETINAAAAAVLKNPDYKLEVKPDDNAVTQAIAQLYDRIIDNILRPLFNVSQDVFASSPVLYYTILALCLLGLLAIGGELVWTLWVAIKRREKNLNLTAAAPSHQCSADEMEQEANQAAAQGDYLTALRILLQAGLLRLDKERIWTSATNRQYLRRFAMTAAAKPLQTLMHLVDEKWYGHSPCTVADWETARTAVAQLSLYARAVSESNAAVNAAANTEILPLPALD